MFSFRKKLLFLAFFLYSYIYVHALSFEPVIKNPSSCKSICWSDDDSMFAVSEENFVFIRDSKNYNTICTIKQNNVDSILFSKENNQNLLLTMQNDGNFCIWKFDKNEKGNIDNLPYYQFMCNQNQKATSVAFSKNSDYVAVALNDNSVNLYYKLRLINQALNFSLGKHESSVYFLNFSDDSNYLISGSEDGVIKLWDCQKNKIVTQIDGNYTNSKVPAVVTSSYFIAACDSENSVSVYNFLGNKVDWFSVDSKIINIKYLPYKKLFAVFTEDNKIHLINTTDFSENGYIFSVNDSGIVDYEFNSDCTKVLVSYNDGSIYKLDVKKVFVKPQEFVPEIVNSKTKKYMNDFLYVYGGANYINSDFLYSANIGIDYLHNIKDGPLYVGGGLEGSICFPSNNMKYEYQIGGKKAKIYLAEPTCYANVGLIFNPAGNNLYFIVDSKVGARLLFDYLFQKKFYFNTNPYVSFYADVEIGVIYKQFLGKFICEYDTYEKFSPGVMVGVNLKIK